MTTSNRRIPEEELYEPIRRYLVRMLKRRFSNTHLEITHRGNYSETLKHLVRHDIVFAFLQKALPDLTGFVLKDNVNVRVARSSDVRFYITVEVKPGKLELDDIFQAKKYGDLFYAKYALLISTYPVGEEIRRLHERLYILYRYRKWKVYVGQVTIEKADRSIDRVKDCIWFPETPF